MTPDRNGGASRMILPVRLTDVPLTTRRRYGRKFLDEASLELDVRAAIEMNAAIETPSDRVYWLPADSVRRVLGDNGTYQ